MSINFAGTNTTTIAGRSTHVSLGGTSQAWQTSAPTAFGLSGGTLVSGANPASSFMAVNGGGTATVSIKVVAASGVAERVLCGPPRLALHRRTRSA